MTADVDERAWVRLGPFLDSAVAGQGPAAPLVARWVGEGRLRVDWGRGGDGWLWLTLAVVDDDGRTVPFGLVDSRNVGLWEVDGGLVYVPDRLVDDDMPGGSGLTL